MHRHQQGQRAAFDDVRAIFSFTTKVIDMKSTTTSLLAAAIISVSAFSLNAYADKGHDHDAKPLAPAATAAEGDMADGEVRKVDKEAKKVTLKHGDIKNLDMPGMTMVFQVKDPAVLDKLQAGDKVKFRAEKAGGAIMVTDIQIAK